MNTRLTFSPERRFAFEDFSLDVINQRLLRGGNPIRLRPKAWDVLCYLIERPGQLVTREALHREIWNNAAVSDDTLTQSIGELRRALGDSTRTPRFIETVHRRGFRFIAPIVSPEQRVLSPEPSDLSTEDSRLSTSFVGRGEELQQLQALFAKARRGARQLVFITGETGIGKTSLVEQFLRHTPIHAEGGSVLHGQCVQQHGQREPYMPVLEAIERHLGSAAGAAQISLMRRVAPHMAGLLPSLLSEVVPGGPANISYDRMLREIGGLLESMAAVSPLILVLEDLHWSDAATLDLLSFLAQRRDPANLFVIGTYRPAEAALHAHPIRDLRQSLRARRRCADLMLGYLAAADVGEYMQARFGHQTAQLAPLIHERTDGNPLFVVMLVEEFIRRGWLKEAQGRWVADVPSVQQAHVVPDDVREVISHQLHCIAADEQTVVEAASVGGVRFDPRIVAAALGRDLEDIEAVCERLVRSHLLLRDAGRSSNRDFDAGYEFAHALQHQVIYDQIAAPRRQRLHRAVGEALESTHSDNVTEYAAQLSMHFERGGLYARAVKYLAQCVSRAQERVAHREAEASVDQALRLLERLPASAERDNQELKLRLLLGVSLNVTHGYADQEVRDNSKRARTLCAAVGDARQLFEIVSATWYAQLRDTDASGLWRSVEELEQIANRLEAPDFRRRAALIRGRTEFWQGNFGASVKILGQVLEATQQESIDDCAHAYGVAPIVAAFMQRGLGLWFLGYPDQARAHVRNGQIRAETKGQPFDLASGLSQAALLELLCGNGRAAETLAERAAAVCNDNDIAFFRPASRFFVVAPGSLQKPTRRGLAEMADCLAEQRAVIGPFFCDVILAFLASAYGRVQKWDDALRCANEGIELTRTNVERIYAAELWRIKGELLVGKAKSSRRRKHAETGQLEAVAHQCFRRALQIAEQQKARSLALRSAMSLARSSARDEGRQEAHDLLASIYGSFTEGFDTRDLIEAEALLEELKR